METNSNGLNDSLAGGGWVAGSAVANVLANECLSRVEILQETVSEVR